MIFTPRPYQTLIRDFIIDTPRCAIWAGMGLGKTVATLDAIDALQFVEDGPVLVLAPLRVARSTWPDEGVAWDHLKALRVSAIVGTQAERLAALRRRADVYTMNYENLAWLVGYWGDKWPYRSVVADESTRLKSFRLRQGGVRAQALAGVAHTKVKRFVELTGTPSPNGLSDLWGQIWMIDKGERLGRSFEAFKQRWFQRSFDGYSIDPLPHAQREIQERLRDICLTIDAKDYFKLDEPIIRNIFVDLPPKARALYKDMEDDMFMQIGAHEIEAFGAASKSIKCLALCAGFAYLHGGNEEWQVVHDEKLDALESVIEEAAGMPVLVAYHFVSDLARLKKRFPKGRELDKKPSTLKDWNDGKIPILFAHPASAGHGLNLQHGGNILVYFSSWWNLEERLQIAERIGPVRQMQSGYNRPVFVYNILARDTIDEAVVERIESKRSVQDSLLLAMKKRLDLEHP